MKHYKFKQYKYGLYYSPYYEQYKDHVFTVTHSTESSDCVWLTCITDPSIEIVGYVHVANLEEIIT
jgi:hypothetical protein